MYKTSLFNENFIINLGLVGLIGLSLLSFGAPPASINLDASWTQALGYAFKNDFQAGVDYIFTYGPLGYFWASSSYDSDLFYLFITWQIITNLLMATLFVAIGSQIEGNIDKFIYYFMLIVVISFTGSINIIGIIGISIFAITIIPRVKDYPTKYVIFLTIMLLFLAILSLTKFTNFLLVSVCLFTIMVIAWHVHSFLLAMTIPFVFTVFLTVVWLLTGQSLLNFFHFLINSLQITSGYSDAMSNGFTLTPLIIAIVIIGITIVMSLLACLPKPWKLERFFIASLVMFGFFIAWKASFVRQDLHQMIFFSFALIVPFFLQYNHNTNTRLVVSYRILRYMTIFIAMSGLFLVASPLKYEPNNFIGQWNKKVVDKFYRLTHLQALKNEREQTLVQLQQKHALPKIRAQVGLSTVDIFSWRQGIVFLNHLNWHPRPVFQSYAAYTPSLMAINGHFYASDKAPEFVIFLLQAIDKQFPWMNDNEALKIFLRDYQPLLKEKGYLLLKRKPRGEGFVSGGQILLAQQIQMNELIDVQSLSDKALLLSLEIQKSWLGKLYSLLYRLPEISLEIGTIDGTQLSYRLISGMAQSDFLLNPLILSQADFVNWYTKNVALKRIATLRVSIKTQPWLQSLFKPDMVLKISEYEMAPYPIDENWWRNMCSMFYSAPYKVSSPNQVASEEEQPVFMVHAPGEMRFRVSAGKHTLTGQFGLLKGAYDATKKSPSDGVEFSASIEDKNRQKLIFKRFLNPKVVESDRGLQEITKVSFDIETEAELVLRTQPGINNQRDWSFWTGIKID
jgi:hypothetical protein